VGDPRVSPLLAPSLAGLPPTYVATAGHDVLRDEGRAYADRLRAAGVAVTDREFPGMVHGFWWMDAVLDEARVLQVEVAAFLRDRLLSARGSVGLRPAKRQRSGVRNEVAER
jgi:acetyl esterase